MAGERTVEGYIANLNGWQAEATAALVALIREAAPDAKGSIKWAQPVFDSGGPAIWIKAFPRWVSIGFWRGAELVDRHGALEGDGTRMKHVKVRDGAEIPRDAIRDYIRQAVALNAEKGDPTRRS